MLPLLSRFINYLSLSNLLLPNNLYFWIYFFTYSQITETKKLYAMKGKFFRALYRIKNYIKVNTDPNIEYLLHWWQVTGCNNSQDIPSVHPFKSWAGVIKNCLQRALRSGRVNKGPADHQQPLSEVTPGGGRIWELYWRGSCWSLGLEFIAIYCRFYKKTLLKPKYSPPFSYFLNPVIIIV